MRQQGAPHVSKAAQSAPSFTSEQAERGHADYAHNCLDCHGSNLDNGEFGGPPLKGCRLPGTGTPAMWRRCSAS